MSEPAEQSTATAQAAPPAQPTQPTERERSTPTAAPRHRTLRTRLRHFRARVRAKPRMNQAWRVGIGVIGTIVLILGIIAIPYPGPGWLIVFAGLGILATEFTWAGRLLRFARRHYDRWMAWVSRQHVVVKALLALLTCAIVLATLWLLGAFGLVAELVGLGHWTWLQSPIV
ncbi:TIGR02611 family protein [Actinomycetospora straminea]|uniref:TIGR02611 family protein n=1 Tax=Actinomycetospora straminea TaxID=663607 RepID=A0ABP9E0N4_9PSEU|nr:TIGR02611 family protein [Actinomycetospora straminea]MDD7934167.1 TIGR02611 family protein [Actinomycetospora straminea]